MEGARMTLQMSMRSGSELNLNYGMEQTLTQPTQSMRGTTQRHTEWKQRGGGNDHRAWREEKKGSRPSCRAETRLISAAQMPQKKIAAASEHKAKVRNVLLVLPGSTFTHRRMGCREPAHYPAPKRACHRGPRPDCY